MALYEMKNGQLSSACIQGGELAEPRAATLSFVLNTFPGTVRARGAQGRMQLHSLSKACNCVVQGPRVKAAWMMRRVLAAAAAPA